MESRGDLPRIESRLDVALTRRYSQASRGGTFPLQEYFDSNVGDRVLIAKGAES